MKAPYPLAAAGGLLIVAAGFARLNPCRWTGLGDTLWLWPFVAATGFAVLGAVCFRAAVAGRGARRSMAMIAAVGTGLAAVLGAGAGLLTLMFWDHDTRVVAVSPDGRFAIVVHDTSNVIDPVEALYVQSTDGPFSRRDFLGCRNSDTSEPFESARFTAPATVVIKAGGQWTLRFDRDEVRAIDRLPDDVCLPQLYTG